MDLETAEIEALRSSLRTDPRVGVMILQRLTYEEVCYVFDDTALALARLALEENLEPDLLRFALRLSAYQSSGEDGINSDIALSFLDECGEGHGHRWMALRTALRMFIRMQSTPSSYMGKDLSWSSREWISRQAVHDSTLLGPMITEAKHWGFPTDSNLDALANAKDIEAYDLSGLVEVIEEIKRLVEGVEDQRERSVRVRLKLSKHCNVYPHFEGVLAPEDVALLQALAIDPSNRWKAMAARRLIAEASDRADLRQWILGREDIIDAEFRDGEWASKSSDLQVALASMERLLFSPDEEGKSWVIACAIRNICRPEAQLPPGQGIALCRRVLDRKNLGCSRVVVWTQLIERYGHVVRDFGDLLAELKASTSPSWELAVILFCNGYHREEISKFVEDWMDGALREQDSRHLPLRLLAIIRSGRSLGILEGIATGAENYRAGVEARREATRLLVMCRFEDRLWVRAFLERRTMAQDLVDRTEALFLLSRIFPFDADAKKWWHSIGQDLPMPPCFNGFQDETWPESMESWRKGLMRIIQEDPRAARQHGCASDLAYWFGDLPETFDFLAEQVRASAVEPVWPTKQATESALSFEERLKAQEARWEAQPQIRKHCLRIIGFRWPRDPRTHELAKEAMDHPWPQIQLEAARLLSREFADHPDTPGRIARHIVRNDDIFGEYTALMAGKPEGMRTALDALRVLGADPEDGGEFRDVPIDGPLHLIACYGPRKDLKAAFEEIARITQSERLLNTIVKVIGKYFSPAPPADRAWRLLLLPPPSRP